MKHLIIGNGEIGKSLQDIFQCDIRDKEDTVSGAYDILHIAYPYFNGFEKSVNEYKNKYNANYVVVHSTVPVGTCKKIGVAHSPVTGVHPHLAESIKTFTKFVAGIGAEEITKEFIRFDIPAVSVDNSDNTEAGKLFNLLFYGINVLLEKEVYDFCAKNNLDYSVVYKDFVEMYNNGYSSMGMDWAKLYELQHKDGGIGGHCILQNAPLLKTDFSKILERLNSKYVV